MDRFVAKASFRKRLALVVGRDGDARNSRLTGDGLAERGLCRGEAGDRHAIG